MDKYTYIIIKARGGFNVAVDRGQRGKNPVLVMTGVRTHSASQFAACGRLVRASALARPRQHTTVIPPEEFRTQQKLLAQLNGDPFANS